MINGSYFDPNTGGFRGFLLVDGNYAPVDVPGAMSTDLTKTNNRGDMVLSYSNSDGSSFGSSALWTKNGGFQEIAFPGAVVTSLLGINERGDLVGIYLDGVNPNVQAFTARRISMR